METSITPARIANAICQDSTYDGNYLLVEGKRDIKLYRRFLNTTTSRIRLTDGKYKLREVYRILAERGFSNIIGIRDADFLRIRGNPKYQDDFVDPIFPTDCHDAEVMMYAGGAHQDTLLLLSDEEKLAEFQQRHSAKIEEIVSRIIYPIGCLRLANKRHQLGLSFKPKSPEGNRLKLHKFVCEKRWQLTSIAEMVNIVWEYSQNKGAIVSSKEVILEQLVKTLEEGHPEYEIVNGHDLAHVLFLVATKGLKSSSKLLQDPSCLEDLLIANFDTRKFQSTELYKRVLRWAESRETSAIFSIMNA